jgi:hypothetical protein
MINLIRLKQSNTKNRCQTRFTGLYLRGNRLRMGMICFILASLLYTSAASVRENDKPYILSSRVGQEINRDERNYFCLFPKMDGFLKAEAFTHLDNHLELRITREMNGRITDTTLYVSTDLEEELQSYLEDFEEIIWEEKSVGVRLIKGDFINRSCLFLKIAGQKRKKSDKLGCEIIVTTSDIQQYSGRILYATDTSLVLWQSNEFYDRRKVNEYSRIFSVHEVDKITEKRKGSFGSGRKYGAIVGGSLSILILATPSDDPYAGIGKLVGVGIVLPSSLLIGGLIGASKGGDYTFVINGKTENYITVLPKLKKKALFSAPPPPELQKFVKQRNRQIPLTLTQLPNAISSPNQKLSPPSLVTSAQIEKSASTPSAAKLHISFGGAVMATGANNDMIDAFNESGFGGTTPGYWGWLGYVEPSYYPEDYSAYPVRWNISAEYNLAKLFRLGLALSKMPRQEIEGICGEWERITGNAYSILVEYVPKPAAPLFMSDFEFAAGAGLCYNPISVDGTIVDESASFELKENLIGLHFRTSLDYYLAKNVSFRLLVNERLMPAIKVPEISRTVEVESYDWEKEEFVTNYERKTLKAHCVSFSNVDFSIGLRFHF